MIKVGILDFGLGEARKNSLLRIQDTIEYAVSADELGFERFWLAEHHSANPLLAWSDPTSLIPLLASYTKHIRIGSGGILLNIHQPYQVVTSFKLFNNLFQNRIDLGFVNGNSFGEYIKSKYYSGVITFDEKCDELLSLLTNEDFLSREHGVIVPPYKGNLPELWSMSSSLSGMGRAIRLGTNFVRSIFHQGCDLVPNKTLLNVYKQRYKEVHHRELKVVLAVSGTCQGTIEKSKKIQLELTLDPKLHIIGDEVYVKEKLTTIAMDYGVDEFIWKDIAKKRDDKFNSLYHLKSVITSLNCEKIVI